MTGVILKREGSNINVHTFIFKYIYILPELSGTIQVGVDTVPPIKNQRGTNEAHIKDILL